MDADEGCQILKVTTVKEKERILKKILTCHFTHQNINKKYAQISIFQAKQSAEGRGRLSVNDMGRCRAAGSFGKHVFAKQLDTFGRWQLSPRPGSCDGWAKEMVEKPDVE
jgi:hypothetical protein